MLLPLLILLIAALAAATVAYGIDPNWAQYPHGLQLILFARRFEFPLIALTLIACVALIALIISGKKRAWWLIGLAPIVTLLGHRLTADPTSAFLVNSDPIFVPAEQASFINPDDLVIGLVDGSESLAFPFASLYSRPMVIRDLDTSPAIFFWSPFANCEAAFRIDRSIQPNEIEIVSMPANGLLAYNSRTGQFISGMTGLTPDGRVPTGLISRIPAIKTTWSRWLRAHPATSVLAPPDSGVQAPSRAVLPYYPMPPQTDPSNLGHFDPNATVALIGNPVTAAVLDSDLDAGPVNFSDPAIVITRDPVIGAVMAFDRRVDEDLVPIFSRHSFKKFPQATMIDADSGSAWTPDGRALDGTLKGKKLTRLDVEDQVYWSAARFWFRNPPLLEPVPGKNENFRKYAGSKSE